MYPNWQNAGAGYVAPQMQMYDPNYQQQMYQWQQGQANVSQTMGCCTTACWGGCRDASPTAPNAPTPLPPLPSEPQPPLPPPEEPTIDQDKHSSANKNETVSQSGQTVGVGRINPTPPVEPPRDEKPPLPPEPPPEDGNKPALAPKDVNEQQKLTSLQQQAAQWQQYQQQQAQAPYSEQAFWQQQGYANQWQGQNQSWQAGQAYPQPVMPQQAWPNQMAPAEAPASVPVNNAELDAVLQEEKDFELQYKQWEQQYNDWREQNKNHPNKDLFVQYEEQFSQYREQMEIKKKDILERKEKAQPQTTQSTSNPLQQQQGFRNMPPNQQGFNYTAGAMGTFGQQQGPPANTVPNQAPGMLGNAPVGPSTPGQPFMGNAPIMGQQAGMDISGANQMGYMGNAGQSGAMGSAPNMQQGMMGNSAGQKQGFLENETPGQQQKKHIE
ncbi:hypothetical protein ScPMuIL_000596 [Solemya velum]